MEARVSTDELEIQLLNIWLFGRRHGDIGTETHNILHTIKTGSDWPVMAIFHLQRAKMRWVVSFTVVKSD